MFDTLEMGDAGIDWADIDPAAFEAIVAAGTAITEAEAALEPPTGIPTDLDSIEPGPVLAAILFDVDVDRLDGYDRVVVLRAHARMAAHYEAHMYADMASVTQFMREIYHDPNEGAQSAAAEIELALTLTRRASESELGFALELRERLPQVWEQFANGVIDRRRARTIANATSHLPVAAARQVVDQVLHHAGELTTGQIAARVRRLCLESDPEDAALRYDHAVAERRVTVEQNPSGTGSLYACDLPADRLTAIRQRIHAIAKGLKTGDETRTMDQLRTDVFLDLLETGGAYPSDSSRGVVDIHIDLATLARLRDTPGEIAGFGPVVADVARQIAADAADAEWRWTVTDDTGDVIGNGITTRRPTAAMRRHVEARRRVCVFPGCRMPATRSDLDHTVPWTQSHRTRTQHLAPLCRHHHTIRHLPGWNYDIDNADVATWRTPLRHTYTRRGPP